MLTRRGVLGGLAGAAIPVLYSMGSGPSALAASAAPAATRRRVAANTAGNVGQASGADDLVRGVERRYHAPLLTPGTRVRLPAGIEAVAVRDYYHRPHLDAVASAWPRLTASDGSAVDASVIPEPGAPTRIAVLSGFTEGWYEVIHASGRADRVTWDARTLPYLGFYGEFGAIAEARYHDRFFTLALEPFSRNPYSRIPLAA
jgi:hypothetical protein